MFVILQTFSRECMYIRCLQTELACRHQLIFRTVDSVCFCAGEEKPTDGTAYIFGKDIRLYPKAARRHVILIIIFFNCFPY